MIAEFPEGAPWQVRYVREVKAPGAEKAEKEGKPIPPPKIKVEIKTDRGISVAKETLKQRQERAEQINKQIYSVFHN